MSNNIKKIKASWIHISDLHVFPEADTTLMLDDYRELAKVISPQFLVVTGDFRHKKYKTDFLLAWDYLDSIIDIFHIDKHDIFLVPGNHDVNDYDGRMDAISDICLNSKDDDYNVYSKYSLCKGFSDYENFVRKFYNGINITDSRVTDPSGVHCVVWNNLINILYVNTALISDGKDHSQILDINALSQCVIDFKRPSIMLGHHGIDSLYPCYAERVKGIIDRRKVSAYLHGDSHQYAQHPIAQISTPNRTIPSITCAKSAPQSGDLFSDIGVVYYEWRNDDNTYVQAYRWTQKGFVEDSAYYYGIDKKFYFPMIFEEKDIVDKSQLVYGQIRSIIKDHNTFMAGNWVKEAEIIWKTGYHEGIGRCLLLFYCEGIVTGGDKEYQRAREIYCELEKLSSHDNNTQKILEVTRSLLYSDAH